MGEVIELDIEATLPGVAEVLGQQGLPKAQQQTPRYREMVAPALQLYRQLAAPRAVLMELSRQQFARIYAGEGKNAEATPVAEVAGRAQRLALFVLTLGEPVCDRIAELFANRAFAEAAMLDATASLAAQRCAVLLEERFVNPMAPSADADWRALAYSPGYCGWDVTGQRALWAALQPTILGVQLTDSCLMRPLKSISGVLLAGDTRIHKIARDYPACTACRTASCEVRLQRKHHGNSG